MDGKKQTLCVQSPVLGWVPCSSKLLLGVSPYPTTVNFILHYIHYHVSHISDTCISTISTKFSSTFILMP
uniref:Uncharacterized protein n=1 Tax=Anguilla anguilla TaxID=7936 RepID=A0A0E9TJQ7_ANGAN